MRLSAVIGVIALVGLAACTNDHPATQAGAAIDRAGTDTGQALGRAATDTGNALDRAGNYVDRKLNPDGAVAR